jgi:hypothetical protein
VEVRKRFLLLRKSSLRAFAQVVELYRFSSVGNFVACFECAAEKRTLPDVANMISSSRRCVVSSLSGADARFRAEEREPPKNTERVEWKRITALPGPTNLQPRHRESRTFSVSRTASRASHRQLRLGAEVFIGAKLDLVPERQAGLTIACMGSI